MANDYTNRLKKRKPDPGDFGWDNEWHENEDIDDVIAGVLLSKDRVISGCAVTNGGGLNADYAGGYIYLDGTIRTITSDTLLLAGGPAGNDTGQANWIYVNSDGIVQVSTTPPSGDYIPLAMADCNDTEVVRIADLRAMGTAPEGMVENDCINGTFYHWQQATSQTSSGYGSDDRWLNEHSGSTKTHTQQEFSVGQTAVPGNPQYYSRTVATSVAGSANFVRKVHCVLDVTRYSGKRVCVVFHGRADAVKNITVECSQNFGSGGSAEINGIDPQKVELTNTEQGQVLFFDLPSVSGKTIGALSYTQFTFWFDAGSNFNSRTDSLGQQSGTFDISEVEIYASNTELPVRRRDEHEEFEKCFSYYWKCTLALGSPFPVYASGYARLPYLPFPETMIQTPSITWARGACNPSTGWTEEFDRLTPTKQGFSCIIKNTNLSAGDNGAYAMLDLTVNAEIGG